MQALIITTLHAAGKRVEMDIQAMNEEGGFITRTRIGLVLFLLIVLNACGNGDDWEIVCIPALIAPTEGEVLDNGCSDFSDMITWHFDWSDCVGAENYHLHVIGSTAIIPAINAPALTSSELTSETPGSYIADVHRFGWKWRVRAKVNGIWGNWTPERTFDVEPLDTDCSASGLSQ
jgi:hypothetical protein